MKNKNLFIIVILGIVAFFFLVIEINSLAYIQHAMQANSGNDTTVLTTNEYVADVNNWTSIIDSYGPITNGTMYMGDQNSRNIRESSDLNRIAYTMSRITPPTKYTNYHAKLEQAVTDRYQGLQKMVNGETQGNHDLYNEGKTLVNQSASEFASISNQTKQITT